ncbi:hypothetical protein [Rhodococcus sp. JVH1]|uniref:hypothetical protein n=1 Tax=Rhodococcus sp. JVH1 TaxID=745408 RepID=UPI0002720800|nr:hypothetical protein [Rhodococcus sp. JVH1]EJJ01037.1 hypothetical protein JVH1_1663 [Rhodococcus sp. JVH1]
MGGRLSAFVHVADEDGTYHQFGPTDTVPEWAAAQITNPAAWAQAPAAVVVEEQDFPAGEPSDQWKVPELFAYAIANSVDLGDAKKKADIVAAIKAAEESPETVTADAIGGDTKEGEGDGDGTA